MADNPKLAILLEITKSWIGPFLTGRSMKKGDFIGLGDHAAAVAKVALIPKFAVSFCLLPHYIYKLSV